MTRNKKLSIQIIEKENERLQIVAQADEYGEESATTIFIEKFIAAKSVISVSMETKQNQPEKLFIQFNGWQFIEATNNDYNQFSVINEGTESSCDNISEFFDKLTEAI